MVAFVQRGFTLSKSEHKQRVRNAKWFENVYTLEVSRLNRSIETLEKKIAKLVHRDKETKLEFDKLCWRVKECNCESDDSELADSEALAIWEFEADEQKAKKRKIELVFLE
jgi:hypothetical protein